MAITSAGIGSGIDIESIVSQLVAAEGQPASVRLNNKEASYQADLSAYGTLKSALSTFQSSVENLKESESFEGRTATSSDTDIFSVSANSTAVAGSYEIEVKQLAEPEKVRTGNFSSGTAVVGTGTLALSIGTSSFQITVDDDNKTLEGIRDSINAASDNPGITAAIINVDDGVGGSAARLVLSSPTVGASNFITVTALDDDLNSADNNGLSQLGTQNFTIIQRAQDAIILVDDQQVTRGSNSFSDVITGVTLDLKKTNVGETETLNIALDTDGVKSKVNSFVESYNTLIDTMNSLSSYDQDNGASGPLIGDSVLRGVKNQIRTQVTSTFSSGAFGSLAELGVKTGENGKLSMDSAKFSEVMSSDFTAVSKLFSSENGLANSLDSVLSGYIDSSGIISARTDGLQTRISSLNDDRERLSVRLDTIEARYRAQFTAMDMIVGQLNSTSSYLTSQLANLPKPNSINRS